MTELLLIILTVLLSGFFSGSEIAFISANRLKLEIESRKKSLNAADR
ncbi:MAG: CNNM domain-containing protein [Balneolaceae bacterium]|nr:CNNM domain-containing protein [Balneolaceae bacterium]